MNLMEYNSKVLKQSFRKIKKNIIKTLRKKQSNFYNHLQYESYNPNPQGLERLGTGLAKPQPSQSAALFRGSCRA